MNRPLVITLAITLPVIAYQYHQITVLPHQSDTHPSQDAHPGVLQSSAPHKPSASPDHHSPGVPTQVGSLQSILTSPDPAARLRALFDYASKIPPAEIGDALAELRANTPDWDPEARLAAHLLLTRWGTEDPDAAFASLEKLDRKRAATDATAILAAFAAGNPQRAIAWLNDPENRLASIPDYGHMLAGTIAKEWVRQDPDAALAWARTLPDDQRAGALTGALRSLASNDPVRASDLALSLEPGKERTRALGEIGGAWADLDPDAALAWATGLDGEDRLHATRRTLDAIADIAPEKAAAHLESIADPEEQSRLLTTVAGSWAETHPAEAASWLADRPESEGKTDAMGWVAWHWTNADPEAASTWLIEQPESPSRDRAITSLAKATFDTDPAAAVTWASAISDPETRDQTLTRGLREWEKRDPNAAATWAAENQ